MGKIILLDELTTCKIAAGEVVERPASVVKEMIDNSIDAGATRISIEIKNGGIKYIKIEDNGDGFEPDDIVIAFDKHATSKIMCADDIENVTTLGFRGEALASIAAVSKVTLKTKTDNADNGVFVVFEGGKLISQGSCGAKKGSSITVENLFFNTPARYKFLKKDQTEAAYIFDVVEKAAIVNPEISFTLTADKKQILYTPGNGDLKSCVYCIFGKEFTQFLKPVSYKEAGIEINGFAGTRELTYGNRNRELTFVNGRFIKNKTIMSAVDEAYKTLVMRGKYPCIILDINVHPKTIDVNVSPAKTEVRFQDDSKVFKAVYHAIYGTLFEHIIPEQLEIKQMEIKEPVKIEIKAPTDSKTETTENKAYEASKEPVLSEVISIPKPEIAKPEPAVKEYVIPIEKIAEVKETEPVCIAQENNYYQTLPVRGQIFDTYIILEDGGTILLIDQHAAHERLMYEKIKKSFEERDNDEQMLLVPVTVTLSPSEFVKFKACEESLCALGFDVSEFGVNSIIIRSVPMILGDISPENFIVGAIRDFEPKAKDTVNVFSDNAIFTMACKAAIKANHKLNETEINDLLKELDKIPDLNTCPHGRPIVVKMTKYEIERKFHRA